MDINQLTSFVDYQLGQKQGWEALSEVLHKLKDAEEQIAKAKAVVDEYANDIEDMKGTLVQMEETAKVKQVELREQLDAIREDHQNALKSDEAALSQALAQKQQEYQAVQSAYDNLLVSLESAKAMKRQLDQENAEAADKYHEIQVKLAAIKGSL